MAEPASQRVSTANRNVPLDPSGQRWWDHMLAGEFEAAWHITDAHRAANLPDPDRMWDGSPIDGRRVTLRCLHGFGDSIMLLRYAPLLRARAASLIAEVNPHFAPLARCFPGIDQVITWGTHAPAQPPAWDVQIEINELPYLFRTVLETIPSPAQLQLPPASLARARAAFAAVPHPRIGLAWESSKWDRSRSLPLFDLLAALTPAIAQRGIQLISLQTREDEQTSGWHELMQAQPHLHTARRCGEGILPLACAVTELDLVISVDTMAAHLAAMLGRPTLLLVTDRPDWRWMRDRADSPWYPTMHLLRQPGPSRRQIPSTTAPAQITSPWQPVLIDLAAVLQEHV